ncbi:MAG: ssDNA-binding domain-containing protein [Chitinophagales bacterium]|nr:ssDNA-binding domain-containing protein [Chitinophagales bacterium]
MNTTKSSTEVTDHILELLDKVTSGDIQHWIPLCGLAKNPITNHTYQYLNQLLLSLAMYHSTYSHNHWMTFKQINEKGGSVQKGERSTMVTFTDFLYKENDTTISKHEAEERLQKARLTNTEASYRDIGITVKRFLKHYAVFNVAQTTGLSDAITAPTLASLPDKERFAAIDHLINEKGITIRHVSANSAHYEPSKDRIQMPFLKQFTTKEHYYAVLFHEIIHWTGHEKRLNRTCDYAFEELIAELGSAFLCAHLAIPAPLTSSAAYIQSWLTALEGDRNYLFKALPHAQRAVLYVLDHL